MTLFQKGAVFIWLPCHNLILNFQLFSSFIDGKAPTMLKIRDKSLQAVLGQLLSTDIKGGWSKAKSSILLKIMSSNCQLKEGSGSRFST